MNFRNYLVYADQKTPDTTGVLSKIWANVRKLKHSWRLLTTGVIQFILPYVFPIRTSTLKNLAVQKVYLPRLGRFTVPLPGKCICYTESLSGLSHNSGFYYMNS